MNQRDIIETYYRAFRERDQAALRSILTPDFRHVSTFGQWGDRDAMLEAIWPGVGQSWAVEPRVFGEDPEYMVRYELKSLPASGRPPMRMAEFVRFEGEKIAEIEVYIGRESPRSEIA